MNSLASGKKLFVLRVRLARRLTMLAAAGLAGGVLLLAFLLGGVAYALASSWGAISGGHPFGSGLWSLCAVLLALCSAAVGDVLFSAPPQPQGIRLSREVAEQLFVLLDSMAARLDIEPIQHVYITDDMNAHVHQRPAWGVIGPLQTCLMIGLPLAYSLSPAQFTAVLAHELGHLAAQRRGWSGVAGTLRAWWARTLDRASAGFSFIAPWLDEKSVRFCVEMLRLARVEEFEADAVAAGLVGHDLMGEALVEVSLKSHFLEHDFWPQVEAHNASRSRPALRPFRDMALGVEAGFMRTVSDHAVAIEEMLAERFAFHPSLQQRLSALRVPCRVPEGNRTSAAVHFLAPLLPHLALSFDRAWWRAWRKSRRRRYEMYEG
ncbi:M48 family metallopeptidase [Thauera linaloolentis]|uniref:Peptidase n=1 Tax=Thauera linaloolentis (strain DSM 12138 / JCM 21573 / CCUG 41526 / CIP 105981 / IAM 15112 / NBRC 102519 / 47Lol) TaxID=1123367 RepID=N6XYH2_THAL4|nr:M48 family metallopeptidase [Thauera linaloolentis]ENO84320.1 peptidase [Thauera linaloolentis 47Lol = DSM 12138]MCM8564412.1 M48 family metallopeptidase [Thauera linaloolentis]